MPLDDGALVVEHEDGHRALEHHERLALGRIAVAMGPHVGALQHRVQEAVRVVGRAGVEIVVHAPARAGARGLEQPREERAVDHLGDHRSSP
ncbi:MAG: hypothetical protein M5U28_04425 [Sandaracinaceae bacterium]|nr:hypothetical protein [Sandaracinaceae bacterium]